MTKRQVIMIIGLWVIFFLFMGFPPSWDKFFAVIAGLLIVGIAYKMAPANGGQASAQSANVPFVEHKQVEHKQSDTNITSSNL